MIHIARLAPELLYLILSYLPPRDIIRFARTCKHAAQFIQPANQPLWKSAFLQIFDNPKHAWDLMMPTARAANRHREAHWDWHHELQRRMIAFHTVCDSPHPTLHKTIEPVVTTLLDVQRTATCIQQDERDKSQSLNLIFLHNLQHQAPNFSSIIHDYHREFGSVSLPVEFMSEPDGPVTPSMVSGRVAIPTWASQFHVSSTVKGWTTPRITSPRSFTARQKESLIPFSPKLLREPLSTIGM
jgi:hypothetical protein